jgi:2-polyprenyl-3-methyl-5-hydroxy-6-metoxy-1,4-benzoquinol methylase
MEFLDPTPTIEELQAYYSGYGTTQISDAEFEFLFAESLTYLKRLARNSRIKRNGSKPRFLEVGFGHGASLVAAASLGFEAYGVDLDAEAIKSLQERARKYGANLNCIHGDISSVSADLSFDLIKASQVIEHTLQPIEFARQLYLRQPVGGRLLMECPNNEAAFWHLKNLLRKRYQRMNFYKSLKLSEHLTGFTKKSIQMLLTNVGYEIKQFRTYPFRDRTYHHETLLWYPNVRDGLRRTIRDRDSYHFLKSLIPVFDSVASYVSGMGTHMAITAEKLPSSKTS